MNLDWSWIRTLNQWVISNKDILTIYSSFTLLVVTAVYVILTNQILRQNNRPYLVVAMAQLVPGVMQLSVRNDGNRRAKNIEWELHTDNEISLSRPNANGAPLIEFQPFKSGIKSMAPGEKKRYLITFNNDIWDQDLNNQFLNFTMRYRPRIFKFKYVERFESTLADYHLALLEEYGDPLDRIDKAIKDLNVTLNAVNSSLK